MSTHQDKIDAYYASKGEESIKVKPSLKFVIMPPDKSRGHFRENEARGDYRMKSTSES